MLSAIQSAINYTSELPMWAILLIESIPMGLGGIFVMNKMIKPAIACMIISFCVILIM